MKDYFKIAGLGAAMLLSLAGCSGEKELTGHWNGQMTLPETGKTMKDLSFDLVQKGDKLTGVMNFTKLDAGNVKLTGTCTEKAVKFNTEYKRGLLMSFDGKLEGKSKLSGTAVLTYNEPKVPVKQDKVLLVLSK